jgi:hypothetical protein
MSETMNLKIDMEIFNQRQIALTKEIIVDIARHLESAGVSESKLKDITGNIAFSISTLLDNSTSFESDGVDIVPYLTFLEGENNLIHCGGNSYLHEYVFGVLNNVFDEKNS